MKEKENKAFKNMLTLMTVSEVLSIVVCVLYIIIGSSVVVYTTNQVAFVPVFVIIGALLIIVVMITIAFKKATIVCYKSIVDDLHEIVESKRNA